jgi:hypothetical protein
MSSSVLLCCSSQEVIMRKLLLVLAVFLIGGCNGPVYKLEARWNPLVQVQQTTDRLITDHTTTTIGAVCFCNDLNQWLQDYPPGSVEYEAILMHERVHSIRQGSFDGQAEAWLAKYVAEPSFRWAEEQLGWAQEITHLVQNGRYVDPQEVATWLSQNYTDPLGRPMVSEANALLWVQATINDAQYNPPPARRIRPH